jgi:rubrerythrin
MARFSGAEIFQMAQKIERDGLHYYRQAAEKFAKDRELRAVFERLAQMEEKHERSFAKLRELFFGPNASGKHAEYDDLAAAYLNALVENKVFKLDDTIDQVARALTSPIDALETAIAQEKESIIFYVGIQEAVLADEGKQAIGQIIREEMTHLMILSGELSRLRSWPAQT